MKAIFETRSSGEVSAHTINMLATWMLEHPSLDPCVEEDNLPAAASSSFDTAMSSEEELRRISRGWGLVNFDRSVSLKFLFLFLYHITLVLSYKISSVFQGNFYPKVIQRLVLGTTRS